MNRPVVLFRGPLAEQGELEACQRHLWTVGSRCLIAEGDLVVGRYSVLPYYDELVQDLTLRGASLINDARAHRYVADLANWYHDFEDLTPKTWFRLEDVPAGAGGSFVLKGATNSRKHLWRTHMFAGDRGEVMPVALRLMDDSMIGNQGIYIRQYENFVRHGEGVQGLPITHEFRWFFLDGEPIAHGFYWSEQADHPAVAAVLRNYAKQSFTAELRGMGELVVEVGRRLKDRIRFAVADVALREDGAWRLVELNDGQMSGLSCVDPGKLYRELAARLR